MTRDWHHNVVRNLRYAYQQRFGHECIPLSDETVFSTWQANDIAPSGEEQDDWTLDDLHALMGMASDGIDLDLAA